MAIKAKILIFLLSVFIVLVLYLILTSESFRQPVNSNLNQSAETENEKVVPLETNYEVKVKEIFTAYEKSARDNNFTIEKVVEPKEQLLSLRVPSKFKELHINFVLALVKMENYLRQKDQQEKNKSLQIISQLKADYSWLNN